MHCACNISEKKHAIQREAAIVLCCVHDISKMSEKKHRTHRGAAIVRCYVHDIGKMSEKTHRTQSKAACVMRRVGQNRIYTPYMTVYMVISLPKTPYKHRI